MNITQPVMVTKVMQVEEFRLRNGKYLVCACLDKSHLDVLRFQSPLKSNRPASARKRRKSGLPEDTFLGIETWLVPPGGAPRQVSGQFGFVDPVAAPAHFSFTDAKEADVPVGSELELRVVTRERNG